jgi:DNA-binding IclR family transcriptional regulator
LFRSEKHGFLEPEAGWGLNLREAHVTQVRGTEAAARVADVLMVFTDGPSALGVTAIARELGLSKAVVHRILNSLVDRKLLSSDPRTHEYHLGAAAAALGARALRGSELRSAAMPVLRSLRKTTNETATVSALVPGGRVYLDQVESTREIKMTVELGRRFPLHAGSSSSCILAFLTKSEQESVLQDEHLEMLTNRTVTDTEALRQRLREIRSDGFSWSEGERQEGAGSIAAPVFGFDGEVVGAISVCGPVARFDVATRERFVPLLLEAAETISRHLGWRGGLPARLERAGA